VNDDGRNGACVSASWAHRIHRQRDGGRRSHEGLQGNEYPHALDRGHDRAVNDLSADRTMAAGDDAIVVSTHDRRPGPAEPGWSEATSGGFSRISFCSM